MNVLAARRQRHVHQILALEQRMERLRQVCVEVVPPQRKLLRHRHLTCNTTPHASANDYLRLIVQRLLSELRVRYPKLRGISVLTENLTRLSNCPRMLPSLLPYTLNIHDWKDHRIATTTRKIIYNLIQILLTGMAIDEKNIKMSLVHKMHRSLSNKTMTEISWFFSTRYKRKITSKI